MPNVLIIGATGYIGSAVAAALLRSGQHTVYGLARTDSSAQALTQNEIIPIFYDRDETDVPRGWVARMKRRIRTLGWRFNTDRMVIDYTR